MIKNNKTNMILATEVRFANTMLYRMIGLIGKKSLKDKEALFIYPCQQIHTFFMRFPIDCLFINKNYEVIETLEDFKPWKVSKKITDALGVIELPQGTIKRTNTQKRDLLTIEKIEELVI